MVPVDSVDPFGKRTIVRFGAEDKKKPPDPCIWRLQLFYRDFVDRIPKSIPRTPKVISPMCTQKAVSVTGSTPVRSVTAMKLMPVMTEPARLLNKGRMAYLHLFGC